MVCTFPNDPPIKANRVNCIQYGRARRSSENQGETMEINEILVRYPVERS